MPRPHEQTYSDSHDETEALYPGPIDNETPQNQIPNPVFDCQPSTPSANRTVLIVDDPNSLLPRSDAGESRYQFRKRKQSKPLSAVKKRFKKTRAKKTRAGPNSMSDVCDKLKTCAIQAQANLENDTNFESDLISSLEIASEHVPFHPSTDEGNSDGEIESSDDSVIFNPRASTPKRK